MIKQLMQYSGCICALVLIPLFTGCLKVGPDFVLPESPVAASWLDSGDERLQNTSFQGRDWWRVFHDPVLDGLIDRAYKENLTLRIAGLRGLEARAQLGVSIGLLFPQTQEAFGSLQQTRSSEKSQGGLPRNSLTTKQDQFGLTAAWELDFWGKFRRNIEAARANLQATEADYDTALVSLTADVADSYITIRTIEKRIEIAKENVETQREGLRLAEARFEGGTVTRLDLEQAKTSLAETQSTVPALQGRLRQSKNALCTLLGIPPDDLASVITGPPMIPVPPIKVAVGIPADLLIRRPDVRSALYQAASQSARIGVAKADLFPSLSLYGTFGFLSTDVSDFSLKDVFRWGSRYYVAGLAGHWNLFNYGRIENNVRVEDARFQQALIVYENTLLKAQQEVENGLAAYLRAQEQGVFLVESSAAAQRSLDIAKAQYKEGARDFTTVLIAQQALLREQDNLTLTLGAASAGLVSVYRAMGGGWETWQGNDFIPPDVREVMTKRTNWNGLLAAPKSVVSGPDKKTEKAMSPGPK
jgi:NodT family efflux transporter outer membrane factor (OMF) lipoprotein